MKNKSRTGLVIFLIATIWLVSSIVFALPSFGAEAYTWKLSDPQVPGASQIRCTKNDTGSAYILVRGKFIAGAAKAEPYSVEVKMSRVGYLRKIQVWRYYNGKPRGYKEINYKGRITHWQTRVDPYFTYSPWRGDQYDTNRVWITATTSNGYNCTGLFGMKLVYSA